MSSLSKLDLDEGITPHHPFLVFSSGSNIGVDIFGRDFLPIYIWLNTQPCLFKNLNKGSVLVVSSCGISLVKLGPRRLGPGPRTVRPWSPIVRFEKTGHLGLRAQLFGDQPIRGPICPEPWNHEMWNEWAGYVCGLWSLTRKARSSVHQLGGLKSVQFLSTCFRLNGEFNTWNEHWAGPSAHAMGGLLYVIPGWWIRLGFWIWF